MSDRTTSPKHDFNRLYSDVSRSIADAMGEIDKLDLDYKQGKEAIGNISGRLRGMQARFDSELGLLEEHAEWEKFTIAFFGETNAGKSTIIESLRILFNEESRQQLLEQNARDLSRYEQALAGHVKTVRQGLAQAHSAYAAEITAVRRDIEEKTRSMLDESAARTASVKQGVTMLERALRDEASTRKQLQDLLERAEEDSVAARKLFDGALARAKRQVWQVAFAGCLLGAAAATFISLMWK